ncbi:LuxR C-terminal-related transcriptional regulator [Ornithinimicrobium sp. F0845]|uniref:helix-turn-helix transcriptional regulator n=1 Tax=Ornithinimicrobium sp. F0845 TaxID=2926412 RepID=UPI001FF42B4B|nr:LuxR C-terminal-related transcriptional regulator [Ornithinimicrobium sp. F0845]MCK0114154.1 LuxR C-terminal-related transcriptional regulator [Ornithinimicrobium sp. F0845]
MARDPYAVVVEMVTAVSHAPQRLEDRVDVIVDILIAELGATIGLLIRADTTHLDVQVIGGRLHQGREPVGVREQIRDRLDDPLLGPITRGDLAPTTAARAHGGRAWQRSAARASCMITFGIDQIATLPVHAGADAVLFVVGRAGPDFTDDDLALLRAVQPVVAGLGLLLRFPLSEPSAEPAGAVPTGDGTGPSLTEREVEVLELLSHGYKAAVIARKAGCSTRTVHRHLGHIYDKLGVSDRLSAVNQAHQLGVIAYDTVDVS